jgi:hypothetical protein
MNHIKFPSRNSWLRSLLLIFSRVIVVLLLIRLLESLPKGSIRTFVNIAGWIGFSVLMGVWSHLFCVLKKETKLWKIQPKSIVEIVNALKVSFWADLIAAGSGLLLFFTVTYAFKLNEKDAETVLGLSVFLILIIWFFSIPLLYKKAIKQPKRKSQTTPKAKTNKK